MSKQTNSADRRHKCSVSIPVPIYESALRLAAQENRSFSNLVTNSVQREIRRYKARRGPGSASLPA